MNFCILPETLLPLLEALCKVVPNKPATPILSNVYISAAGHQVTLQASNLNVTLSVTTDKVSIDQQGWTTVPAKPLLKLIKSLDPRYRLDLALDGKYLTVTQGEQKTTLPTLPAEDFPFHATPVDDHVMYTTRVEATPFKRAIEHLVKVKSDRHPAHLVITGNSLIGTAIDGARLHRAEIPASPTADFGEFGLDVYLAVENLKTLVTVLPKRQPDVLFGDVAGCLYVRCGDLVWIGKLVETARELPVFAPPVFRATLDTAALLLAIKRARIMAYKEAIALRTDETGQLTLYAENAELGDITCGLTPVPDHTLLPLDWRLDINAAYLRDSLANIDGPQVTLRFGFGAAPVWVEPVDAESTAQLSALVMPVHFDSARARKPLADLDRQWDEDARAAALESYRWLKTQMDDATRSAVLAREVAYRELDLTSFRDWAGKSLVLGKANNP